MTGGSYPAITLWQPGPVEMYRMADQPERIQRRRTPGWRMPEGAVYVGRGSMWGNPFAHTDRSIAARAYRCWIVGGLWTCSIWPMRKVIPGPIGEMRARIRAEVGMLRGKTLACWCGLDAACHADVLLELANAEGRAMAGEALPTREDAAASASNL